MIRFFQIAVFGCLGLLLTGCNAPEKSEPIWQQVKITDIAPVHNGKQPDSQLLKTINFNVYIFEMPAENISTLNDVWQMLYTKPLRFNDYDAFVANSFSVGFGEVQMWNKIADLLQTAGAKRVKTVSLLLSDGQAETIAIAALGNEQTIFYISTDGSMEGATIGPGILALRIKAEKIPGLRGVCNVDVQPVFSSPIRSSIPQLAAREKLGEFLFNAAGFRLKMSPGNFVFLGPKKYSSDQITLGSLFFSRPGLMPVVRTFLLVCSRINY
ncbi:hypothetical protein ES703_64973 [subsurface metagenome]